MPDLTHLTDLSQQISAREMAAILLSLVILLAMSVLVTASLWRIFEKAGRPGWISVIPVYNIVVGLRIADEPWWWLILLLPPPTAVIFGVISSVRLARRFGKGVGFGIGVMLLPFIFLPILGFGNSEFLATNTLRENS